LISIFRKNEVVNVFLLLPYAIILRLHSLLHPQAYIVQENDPIFVRVLFDFIDDPLLQSILGVILVFTHGVLINLLANNHRIHRIPSALSGMVYILLASIALPFQILSPVLIATTFILIAVHQIFRTYKITVASKKIANAAFASAMASMIYPPYILFSVVGFVGLGMMRNFKWVERLQYMIGYLLIYWMVGAFLFFLGLLNWDFLSYFEAPGIVTTIAYTSPRAQIILGAIFITLFILLLNYYNFMKKKGIDIRKKIDFFYWLLLCSFLAVFIFPSIGYTHLYFVMISASIFISMLLMMIKHTALAEVLYLCIVITIFYGLFS